MRLIRFVDGFAFMLCAVVGVVLDVEKLLVIQFKSKKQVNHNV